MMDDARRKPKVAAEALKPGHPFDSLCLLRAVSQYVLRFRRFADALPDQIREMRGYD
jgi:hypothetical protein